MNRQFDWKNIKKSDWIVLGLIGAILLVIMLPEKSAGESSVFWNAGSSKGNTLQVTDNDAISAAAARDGSGKDGVEQYVSKLEEKLVHDWDFLDDVNLYFSDFENDAL